MSADTSPPAPLVTLISGDGVRFDVPLRVASVSGMLRALLSRGGGFAEGRAGAGGGGAGGPTVTLPEISGAVLERVVAYMQYKLANSAGAGAPIPSFDIPPELALQLLVAANYLDC